MLLANLISITPIIISSTSFLYIVTTISSGFGNGNGIGAVIKDSNKGYFTQNVPYLQIVASSFRDLKKNATYRGHFERLAWNWKIQNRSALEDEMQKKNALDFIRLEDLHCDQNINSIINVVDTGDDDPGRQYRNGRIYTFALSNPNGQEMHSSPKLYGAKFFVMLDGSAGDDIRNPDNVPTSRNSNVIQEDLNDYNRIMDRVN